MGLPRTKEEPQTPFFIKHYDFCKSPGMYDLMGDIRELAPSKSKWKKAQGVSYYTDFCGLYSILPKKQTFKWRVDEILRSVGRVIGINDIKNWGHYATYLIAKENPKP